MEATLLLGLLLFFLKHKVTYASSCTPQPSTEYDVYLQGFTLESFKVNTIFPCYTKCEDNILCTSINMNLTDKTCELKYSTKTRHPEKIVERQNMIYMEIRDDNASNGSRPDIPILSCKALKDSDSQAKSGVYWMKFNDPSSMPFQVFCEMTIDGGGWTLVYSYTFTQYNSFSSGANAVTPIPNWPVDKSEGTWIPAESTTTPLNESSYSAMDFALWRKIGNEFLIKSNITNWVACVEGAGSLVNWVAGSVTCRVVKAITPTCTTVAPAKLILGATVMLKHESGIQIFFDGRTDKYFPTHDPCASNSANNHLSTVMNPSCSLYVR